MLAEPWAAGDFDIKSEKGLAAKTSPIGLERGQRPSGVHPVHGGRESFGISCVEIAEALKEADCTPEVVNNQDIPLRMRFNVMQGDNFRCVLCGNSPPVTPGLVLHVDHIIPWSKDGKARLHNLRTLCADCNIGRGNLYDD